MIASEFEHYFRLSLNRTLTGLEEIQFFVAVKNVAGNQIITNQANLSHNTEYTSHFYDVGLLTNINANQAETIFNNLKSIFPNDSLEYSIS